MMNNVKYILLICLSTSLAAFKKAGIDVAMIAYIGDILEFLNRNQFIQSPVTWMVIILAAAFLV